MTSILNATTPDSLAVQQLREMLSGVGAFQEAVGATSKEEAAEFIHVGWYSIPEGQQPQKSHAVIYKLPGEPHRRLADGTVMPAGQLLLDLWLNVESTDDPGAEEVRCDNWHGAIQKAINEYDGSGYLMLATQTGPPERTNPAHVAAVQPDTCFWFVQYTVRWDSFGPQ